MSTLSLRLPDSLHEQVKLLAKKDGISINHFISSAIAEKMSALLTEEYLQSKAEKGSKEKYLAVLSKAPDVDPEDQDKLK